MKIQHLTLVLAAGIGTYSSAQTLYDTPESRRLQAEEQQRKAAQPQPELNPLEQKEAEALTYVGKTFWFIPNPDATRRIRFYEKVPPSSHSQDPNFIFTPLTTTSLVVTGILMPPPKVYPQGKDEFLLAIQFPDGKTGYVNVVGCCGLKENLYQGNRDALKEYISFEQPDLILAREADSRAQKAKTDEEEKRKKEEDRLALQRNNDEQARQRQRETELWQKQFERDLAQRQKEYDEQQRKQAERSRKAQEAQRARMALPNPKLGMTQRQIVDQTSWGRPADINRTITATGTREQWVYGNRRYLYFQDGILTAIQD